MINLTYVILNRKKDKPFKDLHFIIYNGKIINSLYCSENINNGFMLRADFLNDNKTFLISDLVVKKRIFRADFPISIDNEEFNSVANWAVRRHMLKRVW